MGKPCRLLKSLNFVLVILTLWGHSSCGTDPDPRLGGEADVDIGQGVMSGSCMSPQVALVVTTDFTTGGTALVDLDARTTSPDHLTIHPDAVVRCPCGAAVILERLGGDNLALLSSVGDRLQPIAQLSLGRRSNPQDAVFLGDLAYVTLQELNEVQGVDLSTGQVVERLDFMALADGDGNAEPASIYALDDQLYVTLQLLDQGTSLWDPTGSAVLAILSRRPLTLEGHIELHGHNPVTLIKRGAVDGAVFIGHAGLWSEPTDGGIELIDLYSEQSVGLIIDGVELGGSVIDFALVTEELAYATVNVPGVEDQLVAFDPSAGRRLDVIATGPPYSLVRVIFDDYGGRAQLVVASRDHAGPGLRFFDALDGTELDDEPVPTGLPPFDLCLLPAPPGALGGDADADADADGDAGGGCDFDWDEVEPFADEVVEFLPAEGATFGAEKLPEVVLGPPVGRGEGAGSMDVVSLGCGGAITLGFDEPLIVDRPGPDFIVFENAFITGELVFAEPAQVSVSVDGETFVEFPCDPVTLEGCAGQQPVLSSPQSCLDPTDPAESGGDLFDLAELGISEASYVRIVDRSAENEGAARWCTSGSAGFDLDAISVVLE